MPVFVWKGRTMAGESQAGELTFDRQEEAIDFLRKKRILVTSLREKAGGLKIALPKFGGGGVSTKDMAIFTRQFATMISAGLPLVQCLDILSTQCAKPAFAKVIGEVTREVEAGSTLADALGKNKKVFDDLFRNMVQAGEAGGILDDILMRLAQYIEKADALKRKIQGAMIYPAVVLTVAMGATAFMLLFIIPTFAKMFTDFGGELPLPTKLVLGASNLLRGFWWLAAAIIVGTVVGLKKWYTTDLGQKKIDGFLLKMPVLGDVLLKGAVARFTRTLGTLITSGVPILTGLEITARTAGNRVIADAILQARASIREGETVGAPLKASNVFPPMVVQMISVGEQTGALDEMLTKIAVFYESEVDQAVENLTSVIEPVMIVLMGGIVGGMVVAMYLPMFKLISVVSGGHEVAAVSVNVEGWRREGNPDDDAWRALGAITRWRLVVGLGALGLGLLLRPDVANGVRWSLLGAGWAVSCVLTGAYALLVRTRRRLPAQAWLQAIVDCVLITAVSVATGGPDSQFVLFYVVVVLWSGVLLETTGGLVTAGLASTGYLCLAWGAPMYEVHAWTHGPGSAPAPVPYSPALIGFLVLLGAIAGSLGGRVRRTQKTLEQASREVERARLDTDVILEHLPSGVLTLDTSGIVLHYNRSAEEILGAPLSATRGQACNEAFGANPKPMIDKIAITLDAGRPLGREEVLVKKKDGREAPIGLSTAFLFDEHGNRRGVIAVFADLSEFKAVEERARRSETLAAIGQLSAGIAHEIRNCLNPISGSVEYLQKELVVTGEGAHLMSLISSECERLNRFVTELLDYAREPRFHLQVMSINDLLADAIDLARRHPAYRKDISLTLEDAPGGAAARVDREQFKRVLMNVLQNALEALDGPGRITVRVIPVEDSRMAIEVSDNGPGIPAEQVSRVTEPFFTTKHGGTGLGLAIASRIMERLGGKLRVTSRPGEGTTFTMELERETALEHAA